MKNNGIHAAIWILLGSLLSAYALGTEIRIGYQKSAVNLTLLKQRGVLETALAKQGDTVVWKEFAAGPQLLEALNVGSIDFGSTGDTPPVFAQANGTALTYVGHEPPRSQSSAILLPHDSKIHSLADLKGKRIAFQKGSSAHYFLIKALDSVHLTLNDIQPAYLPPADARAAFEQGAVDAWVIWDPYFAAVEETAQPKILVTGKGFSPGYTFYLASKEFAKANQKLISQVFDLLSQNDAYIKSHRADAIKLLSEVTGLNPNVYGRVFERRPSFKVTWLDAETVREQQKLADRFHELNIIQHAIVVDEQVFHP
jgi:sulfonate transport system substrate-binding protein